MDCFYPGEKLTIKAVWSPEGQYGHKVGQEGVTQITVEHANGQMAEVAWLAVWKGDVRVCRMNAAHVGCVEY